MAVAGSPKKYLIKFLKILAWIISSLVLLLVSISLIIQIPAVQNKIVQKVVGSLKEKIKTEVRLRHVSLSFPKRVVLEGLYVEDQSKDTLLYIGKLGVDTDLWALVQKTIELNDVQFDTLSVNITRALNDTQFNFGFIVDAFSDTTKTTSSDSTATPWEFSVENVGMTQTRVLFDDKYDGNDIHGKIGQLEISTDEFDLNERIIRVDELSLVDAKASYSLSESKSKSEDEENSISDSSSSPFQLGVNQIDLEKINFTFNNYPSRQLINVSLLKGSVDVDEFNLNEQIIKVNDISLENSFVSYHQMVIDSALAPDSALENETKASVPSKDWLIAVNEIDLINNTIQYYNFNHPADTNSIDFNRIWISRTDLSAEDLRFHGTGDLAAKISSLSLHDKSGFSIQSLQTDFLLTNQSFALSNFNMVTGSSSIQLEADAKFISFKTLSKTYPDASLNLRIKPSVFAVKDILFLSPQLLDSLPLTLPSNSKIKLDALCTGQVKDLKIHHVLLETLSETSVNAQGTIRGLPDTKKTALNLELKKLYTTKADLTAILPDSLLPQSISTPGWISISGKINGTLNEPIIESLLDTDLGSIEVQSKINFDTTAAENYDGHVRVNQFQLGKLLSQDSTMGHLDMELNAKGRGFAMRNMDALISTTIHEFQYNHYNYRNFIAEGSLKKYFFSGTAVSDDKNFELKMKGDLDYHEKTPRYKLNLEVKNADFQALNLSERPLRMRGTLDVDLATPDFKVLNGNVTLRKVAVFNGDKLYAVDSLLFASIDQRGESEITIRSDILSGEFKGNINIFSLPEALKRHVNQYFSLRDSTFDKPVDPQNFKFNLVLKNTELFTEIIFPELEPFVPGEIAGEFNSLEHKLKLNLTLSRMSYAGVSLDSILLRVKSDKNSLSYSFSMKKIKLDTLRMEELKLSGNVTNDSIYTVLSILDSLQKEKYVIGGVFNSYEDAFQFRFLQRHLKLNYEPWTTPLYNTLRFTDKGLVPNNFYISHQEERILLIKKENQDSTLTLAFRQVDLKKITSFLEGVTPVGGIIDGELTMGVAMRGSFESALSINRLKILEQNWGDLALKLAKRRNGPITIDLDVQGENIILNSNGSLSLKGSGSEIHLNSKLSKFNLTAVEPLTMKRLKNLKGQLTGDLKIDGDTRSPSINGNLLFSEVEFIETTYTGNKFSLKDERLQLTGSGLVLRDFGIRDGAGNTASINGSVKRTSFRTFDLSLTLDASNFQIINTTEKDNELFYGNVRINTKARITGSSDFPRIQMNASLSPGSEFTYVIPETEKAILEQEGIVKFVDRDAVIDPFLATVSTKDTLTSSFTGIDLTANIELNDKVTFNIIIDPITGDKLSVKGNSTLTLDIDETGDMQLSGRYEISEGTYNLSFYKLVKRQFKIEKGGTIIWSGDALSPELDIRALYEVETSPIDLVVNQIPASDLNAYRRRLTFLVYLILKGELLSPDIRFELDMPPDEQDALGGLFYAKIRDINTRESELNKQVFALLILNRFVSDNPFSSQGSDVAQTARTSVSQLLSEQLNRLGENVKGVQLTFDVKSYQDYTTGEVQGQTQLELGISKSLLNDRLIVKVAGNVDVEGDVNKQDSFADYIGDLALEYKLTPDGRLRITAFRNSNYDMIDGELTETGAGLIYIKDYDAFRELFKADGKGN